ncbi:MAG: regulatory protein RecX [Luteimonas sp.]
MEPAAPSSRKRRARPETTPAQRALGLLVRREHSRKELARKLAARGVGEEEAAAAITRMTAEGWQSDARFAASLAQVRASGGYGPLRIRAELGMHALDEEVIAHAFVALAEGGEDDWPGKACGLVRRRFGAGVADDLGLRRKAANFLLRRGFDSDTIRAAIGGN